MADELARMIRECGGDTVACTGRAIEAITLATDHKPDSVLMDVKLRGGAPGIGFDSPQMPRLCNESPATSSEGGLLDFTRRQPPD